MLDSIDSKWKVAGSVSLTPKDFLANKAVITVHPMGTLALSVRGSDGPPVKDAEVYLSVRADYSSRIIPLDDNGEGSYSHIRPGTDYQLRILAYGYEYRDVTLPKYGSPEWTGKCEVALAAAARTITGKVVDKDGKPVAGATVTTYKSPKVTTDADGVFTVTRQPDNASIFATDGRMSGSAWAQKGVDSVVIKLDQQAHEECD